MNRQNDVIITTTVNELGTIIETEANRLIRCRDCRYWQYNQEGHYPNELCRWNKDETPDADDYCSYAERMESDE